MPAPTANRALGGAGAERRPLGTKPYMPPGPGKRRRRPAPDRFATYGLGYTAATLLQDSVVPALFPEDSTGSTASTTAVHSIETHGKELSTLSFAELGLEPGLLKAVHSLGYTEPTPIQEQAIPAPSPAATSSAAPRPAPARRPLSSCPPCN